MLKYLCLYCCTVLSFSLSCQVGFAQKDLHLATQWMKDNVSALGGKAVLLVYKDGKVIYNNAENSENIKFSRLKKRIAGKTGRDIDVKYNSHTVMAIASSSKWLTAALAMSCVEANIISLNDSIGKYLPVMTKHGKGNILVSECLSHTTGIKPATRFGLEKTDEPTMEAVMEKIAALPMESKHGESFHYGSIGLQIIAGILEKQTGKKFETLFQERIAFPLGMSRTSFGDKPVILAAGGAKSSAEDYMKFLVMILNKGNKDGVKILHESSINLMEQNRIKNVKIAYSPVEAKGFGYGFGLWTMENSNANTPAEAVTSPGLFGSFPWIDNKRGYAAVLLCTNLKQQGRNEGYKELKKIIDASVGSK